MKVFPYLTGVLGKTGWMWMGCPMVGDVRRHPLCHNEGPQEVEQIDSGAADLGRNTVVNFSTVGEEEPYESTSVIQ